MGQETDIRGMAGPRGSSVASGVMERLRRFLLTLPEETCARILEAIERDTLTGEEFPGSDLTISALVAVMADRQLKLPRLGNPKRYFFAVLDPFLIDEELPR